MSAKIVNAFLYVVLGAGFIAVIAAATAIDFAQRRPFNDPDNPIV